MHFQLDFFYIDFPISLWNRYIFFPKFVKAESLLGIWLYIMFDFFNQRKNWIDSLGGLLKHFWKVKTTWKVAIKDNTDSTNDFLIFYPFNIIVIECLPWKFHGKDTSQGNENNQQQNKYQSDSRHNQGSTLVGFIVVIIRFLLQILCEIKLAVLLLDFLEWWWGWLLEGHHFFSCMVVFFLETDSSNLKARVERCT